MILHREVFITEWTLSESQLPIHMVLQTNVVQWKQWNLVFLCIIIKTPGILKDNTMDDKLIKIIKNDNQNEPLCRLLLLAEMFEHYWFRNNQFCTQSLKFRWSGEKMLNAAHQLKIIRI